MIVISSGHGLYVRGAAGPEPWGLDEVNEARRVVDRLKQIMGDQCEIFHDDTSHDQDTNLHTIVAAHNKYPAEGRLDVSVHFNAYMVTEGGRGVEVCYVSQQALAEDVALAIANAGGLIDRGGKKRSDLYFLNKTTGSRGAILIETCFVDAHGDCDAYNERFNAICSAIANTIGTMDEDRAAPQIRTRGKVSWFGGPEDTGVASDEGLAFLYDVDDKPELFLDKQPPGTTGLARRLNSDGTHYIAMRWDYDMFPKEMLAGDVYAMVRSPKTGKQFDRVAPADWGPNSATNRIADISKKLMDDLGIETDDDVEVTFPVEED